MWVISSPQQKLKSDILLNDLVDEYWAIFLSSEVILLLLIHVLSLDKYIAMTDVAMYDIPLHNCPTVS